MQKWEYLIVNVTYRDEYLDVIRYVSVNYRGVFTNILHEQLADYLKELENEGWQLLQVDTSEDTPQQVYQFRRPIHLLGFPE